MKWAVWCLALSSCVGVECHGQYVTPICGTSDDTKAVQAAIDSGKPVLLPVGPVNISSLNITNRGGVVLRGCGNAVTTIIPLESGVNVIDLTGASYVTLSDFQIAGARNPDVQPATGILCAQPNGVYASNVVMIDHVRVDGYFQIAALYNLGVVSSCIEFSQFYNYIAYAPTVVFTGNNFFGVQSFFTAIDASNQFMPSDWTFTQVEMHNFGGGAALWVGGGTSLRWFGGNIASSGVPVSINGVYTPSGIALPRYILFNGTTFYNDDPPAPPRAITNNAGVGVVVRDCDSGFPIF